MCVLFGSAASVGLSSHYLVAWLHFSEGRSERRFVLRGGGNESDKSVHFVQKTEAA